MSDFQVKIINEHEPPPPPQTNGDKSGRIGLENYGQFLEDVLGHEEVPYMVGRIAEDGGKEAWGRERGKIGKKFKQKRPKSTLLAKYLRACSVGARVWQFVSGLY